jgi:hypothetical protein
MLEGSPGTTEAQRRHGKQTGMAEAQLVDRAACPDNASAIGGLGDLGAALGLGLGHRNS